MTVLVTDGTVAGVLAESSALSDARGTARYDATFPSGLPVRERNAIGVASSIHSVFGT